MFGYPPCLLLMCTTATQQHSIANARTMQVLLKNKAFFIKKLADGSPVVNMSPQVSWGEDIVGAWESIKHRLSW